jgi:hypothetical protein
MYNLNIEIKKNEVVIMSNKIYFVERPKHGGFFKLIHDEMPNWKGQRSNLEILDDYAGDAILADSCKAVSSMGLS